MKVILSMIKEKEMENLYEKLDNIILVNGKIIENMVKEQIIIRKEILYMKVIMLMENWTGMENLC